MYTSSLSSSSSSFSTLSRVTRSSSSSSRGRLSVSGASSRSGSRGSGVRSTKSNSTSQKQQHRVTVDHSIPVRPPSAPSTRRFVISNGSITASNVDTTQNQPTQTPGSTRQRPESISNGKHDFVGLGDLVDDLTYISVLKSDILLVQRRIDELQQSLKSSHNGAILSEQRRHLEDQLSQICCTGGANTNGSPNNLRSKVTLFEILFNKMSQLEKVLLRKTERFADEDVFTTISDGGLSRLPWFFAVVSRLMHMQNVLQMVDDRILGPNKIQMDTIASPVKGIRKKFIFASVSQPSGGDNGLDSRQNDHQQQQREIELLLTTVKDLQGKLQESQSAILEREKELADENKMEKENQRILHRKSEDRLRKEIDFLKGELKKKDRAENELQSIHKEYTNEMQRLQQEIADQKKVIDDLCRDYEGIQEQLNNADQSKTAAQEENELKDAEMRELHQEIESLRQALVESQQQQQERSDSLMSSLNAKPPAQEELKWHQKMKEQEQEFQQQLHEQSTQNMKELQVLRSEHSRLTIQLMQRITELEQEMAEKVNSDTKKSSQKDTELITLRERITAIERKNVELDGRKNRLNEHKLKLEKEISELVKKQLAVEKLTKKQKSEIVRLQAVEERYIELCGEEKTEQRQKQQQKTTAQATQERFASMQQYMKKMEQSYAKLNSETTRLQEKLKSLVDYENLYKEAVRELDAERKKRSELERRQQNTMELPLVAMKEVQLLSEKIIQAESALKHHSLTTGLIEHRARRNEQLAKKLAESQDSLELLKKQLHERDLEMTNLRQQQQQQSNMINDKKMNILFMQDGENLNQVLVNEIKVLRRALEQQVQMTSNEMDKLKRGYESQLQDVRALVQRERDMSSKKLARFQERCKLLEQQLAALVS